jgi:hypothetical protein
VLSFLPLADLPAATRVSKGFQAAAEDEALYQAVCTRMGVSSCASDGERPWFALARSLQSRRNEVWDDFLSNQRRLRERRLEEAVRQLQNARDRFSARFRRRSQALSSRTAEPGSELGRTGLPEQPPTGSDA